MTNKICNMKYDTYTIKPSNKEKEKINKILHLIDFHAKTIEKYFRAYPSLIALWVLKEFSDNDNENNIFRIFTTLAEKHPQFSAIEHYINNVVADDDLYSLFSKDVDKFLAKET